MIKDERMKNYELQFSFTLEVTPYKKGSLLYIIVITILLLKTFLTQLYLSVCVPLY